MKKKKDKNTIEVKSLGMSTTGVTGSCWNITYPKNDGTIGSIIIECGLSQSEQTTEGNYNSNKRMLENINKDIINNCEYVFICHSHVDHVGNLSIFNDITNSFKGKIFGSTETIAISKELLKDTVYVHKKNVEYLKSKGSKVKPLYTEPEMYSMFNHMESVVVNKKIKLNENLSFIFRNNSHTLGSTNLTLEFTKPNNTKKKIIYSSDMGSQLNNEFSYYLKKQDVPKCGDLFISEATYSDSKRQITDDDVLSERIEMRQLIKQSILEGKRVLLPSFAFSKAQLLVTLLKEWFEGEEWFDKTPVVMDGLLMSNINNTYLKVLNGKNLKLFKEVMNMKNLKINKTYDGTKAILSKRESGIYIVSSGFLCEGRITTYLPQFLESSKDVILINGYCGGEDSRGGLMLNPNVHVIKIDKSYIQKKALIKQYKTFSSHISHDELLELWSELKVNRILIHHCDEKNKENIIKEAKEYMLSKNKTTQIECVDKDNNTFYL